MAQLKTITGWNKESFSAVQKRHSGNLAGFVFIAVGLLITLAGASLLNIFIQGIVQQDYDRTARNTVNVLVGGISELEKSVETVATVFLLAEDAQESITDLKIHEAIPNISLFDQVFLVHGVGRGQWAFKTIQMNNMDDDIPGFKININKEFLGHILNKKYLSNTSVKILSDSRFFNISEETKSVGAQIQPFAFIKPLKANDASAGFVVGVSRPNVILDDTWLRNNDLVSRLSIRDLRAGQPIFHFTRGTPYSGTEIFSQVYEFNIADTSWEIRVDFLKEQTVYFLETIPYFILIFGFILTTAGVYFVYNNQKHATFLQNMNRELENKNIELEEEVHKRERLNLVLKRSERENRAIVDAVSDIIFETDTNGMILFLNSTWKKVTGFDQEQSQGQDLFKMIHPQDQDKQRGDFTQLVSGQRHAYRSFTRLRTADGIFRAVELSVSMIRQDEAKNLRVVGTITDVEERRRAERALSEAEKKYRTIVENAAGGIFQLTPEGLYLSANPSLARILKYEQPEDLLRRIKNANEEVYISLKERQNILQELEFRGAVHNYETRVRCRDGSTIWVNENIHVVRDDNGNTLYYEGSMEDISRRKQSEMALREAKIHSDLANRAKSEFLANMSHELRTPLNAIIGFSEIIKNEVFGPVGQPAYKEYANDIHSSGQNLLGVINEILDISKIEAHERQLNEGIVNVQNIVGSCMTLIHNKVQVNHLTVTNMLRDHDVPKIVAEELAIKQIVMNLLSNAVKFTPAGGHVTIDAQIDKDGQFCLSFTDTGIGLDEAEIQKALSPFGQVDNAFNRSGAGTGLGLTLVDALVRLHDGNLEIFSQKGIGTTVTVILPPERIVVDSSQQGTTKEAGERSLTENKRKTTQEPTAS